MGVDYYACGVCSETFPDCGEYGYCICELTLCSYCVNKFKKKFGEVETAEYGEVCNGCDVCQLVEPSDFDLLNYALSLLGIKHKDFEEQLRTAVKDGTYKIKKKGR